MSAKVIEHYRAVELDLGDEYAPKEIYVTSKTGTHKYERAREVAVTDIQVSDDVCTELVIMAKRLCEISESVGSERMSLAVNKLGNHEHKYNVIASAKIDGHALPREILWESIDMAANSEGASTVEASDGREQ